MAPRTPPSTCPVCGQSLGLTRLSCRSCGTEITGDFQSCEFCSLAEQDRETLRVFLASRGNMKEVERHLGVSYPTARARFDALLGKLGIRPTPAPAPNPRRLELLERLARGEVDVDQALERLENPAEDKSDDA